MSYKRTSPQPVVEGGTGAQTLTVHGVLVGEGTGAIVATTAGAANTVLLGQGAADPSFGTVPNAALTNSSITLSNGTGISITGSPVSLGGTATINLSTPVSIANGGTNATSMATTDGTVYFDGTRLVTTATGTSGFVLTSGGVGVAPTYQAVSASGAVTSVGAGSNISITGTSTAPVVNLVNSPSVSGSVTAGTGLVATTGGVSATGNSLLNGGTVGIGSDPADNTLSIGTSASAGRTINIGNTTGTTGIIERVGTGNFSLDGAAGSTYAIGASTTTGTITIGGTAETGTITLGSSSGTNIVDIGAGTGATIVNIANGATNAKAVNIATGAVANVVAIGSTSGAASITERVGTGNYSLDGAAGSTYTVSASTTTGTITIGGTAQIGTMTLGSSSGTNTLVIAGGSGATTLQLANAQTAGSVSIGAAMTTGTLSIGGTGAQTGNVDFAPSTGAQTVTLANNNGAKTLNIGNGVSGNTISIGNGVNTSTQVVNIASGAAGATSTVNILTGVSTAGTQTVNIATGAAASTTNIGNVTGASALVLKSGSGNIAMNTGLTVDSLGRTTNTKQSAFLYRLNTPQSNVTGDGTQFTCVFDTKIFDQNNDVTSNTTFTAPKTGLYHIGCNIYMTGLTASHTTALCFTGGTKTVLFSDFNGANVRTANNDLAVGGSVLCNYTAGDTVTIILYVAGGTKVVTENTTTTLIYSYFYGYQVA